MMRSVQLKKSDGFLVKAVRFFLRVVRRAQRILIVLFVLQSIQLHAQTRPTYELRILNTTLTSPTSLEFEIYLLRTGEIPLEYAGAQYHIAFNTDITTGTLSYSMISSDLPLAVQPANPQVFGNELRLTSKSLPGAGNGFAVSAKPPGTMVAKMRLTTSDPFTSKTYQLQWRNEGWGNPFTKIAAYVDSMSAEIQDSVRHYSGTLTSVPQRETSLLKALVMSKGIELKWTTTSWGYIRGFELERRYVYSSVRFVGKETREPEGNWKTVAFIPAVDTGSSQTYAYVDPIDTRGMLAYRLNEIDKDSSVRTIGSAEVIMELSPKDYGLSQNYPNPFNPTTTFRFAVPSRQHVSSRIYDLLGRLVMTLFDETADAHVLYVVTFDAKMLSSGVYLSVLQTSDGIQVKKMMLLK